MKLEGDIRNLENLQQQLIRPRRSIISTVNNKLYYERCVRYYQFYKQLECFEASFNDKLITLQNHSRYIIYLYFFIILIIIIL